MHSTAQVASWKVGKREKTYGKQKARQNKRERTKLTKGKGHTTKEQKNVI